MNIYKNRALLHLAYSVLVIRVCLFLYGCANMARPGGGPIDETPPSFVKSTPSPFQKNVKGTEIQIYFNENIELESASEKVIVSPPQKERPIVRSNARVVTVEILDSLLPNTTYTIDFSDAIKDLNEGNVIPDFSFAFSTGPVVDSLAVSGTVLEASNLEPVTGILVGLQSDMRDSAFLDKPFERVAKTNAYGRFSIRNVKPGSYKIYALQDANGSYSFDMPSENVAFLDSLIIPSVSIEEIRDTVWADSITIDSIQIHRHSNYFPNDLLLLSFNENKQSRYFEKAERLQKNKLTLYFGAPNDTLPRLEGMNFNAKDWAVVESSPTFDTISYWIKDSLIYNLDTLKFLSTYLYTDTLQNLVDRTDTLAVSMRAAKKKETKKSRTKDKDEKPAPAPSLAVRDKIPATIDIGVTPTLEFDEPLLSLDPSMIYLELKKDSVYVLQPSKVQLKEGKVRQYEILGQYKPGMEYLISIDSAAIQGLSGLLNKKFEKSFKVKAVEEYSNLVFNIRGVQDSSFVELLSDQDKVLRKAWVENGQAKFIHVAPGTYYARIVLDENKNFLFDTGDYLMKKQPETVLYYTGPIELKANWDVQQDWNVYETPIVKQKPLDITKNKPEEKKNKYGQGTEAGGQGGSANTNNQYGGGSITGGMRLQQ